jgi:hypothetical protein
MLSMKHVVLALFVTTAMTILAGCSQSMATAPTTGTVIGYQEPPRAMSPDPRGPIIAADGKTLPLFSLCNSATILVFTQDSCLPAGSPVVQAASQVGRNVSVIEISGPADSCEAHAQCIKGRGDSARDLVSLCDAGGLLRSWYGISTPSAVVVLDAEGTVLSSGSMSDFELYRLLAESVARQANRSWSDVYGGD